jgi:uncharacterized protein YneR
MKKKFLILTALCVAFAASFFTLYRGYNKPSEAPKVSEPDAIAVPQVGADEVESKAPERWPISPLSPVLKSSAVSQVGPPSKNSPPKRYLTVNPIKLEEKVVSKNENGIRVDIRYPQISGLIDKSLESRINADIKSYGDRLLNYGELYSKGLKEIGQNFYMSASFNNVICINLYQRAQVEEEYITMQETLLYELVEGRKLELKDIFAKGSDFPRVLNRAVEEHILKNNLEEQILKAPFKGIREGQGFMLTEDRLTLMLEKNEEFVFNFMYFGPSNIVFRLSSFSGLVDIYDKFSAGNKKIYESEEFKKKTLPNDFDVKFIQTNNIKDNYKAILYSFRFENMKNSILERELNELCSDSGEEKLKSLLPKAFDKSKGFDSVPTVNRSYILTANYCDLICIEVNEDLYIPEVKHSSTSWHSAYNTATGKKLLLQDFFRGGYDWNTGLSDYIKESARNNSIELQFDGLNKLIEESDFGFDEEHLWINLKPDIDLGKNREIFSIPFTHFGYENLAIVF